jgi:hypothetical protein
MLRARLAALAAAAGLSLACGCSTLANHPWFSHPAGLECADCDIGTPISGGPVLEDFNPGQPVLPGNVPNASGIPPAGVGPLRPVPQTPALAQPDPYRPSKLTPIERNASPW